MLEGNDLQRFLDKIEMGIGDKCWLWTAAPIGWRGYGQFYLKGKPVVAHRLAYEFFTGNSIPIGLVIDHLCHNPPCVNPKHLEPVTNKENARRGDGTRDTYCRNGHERTEKNTYTSPANNRQCKDCINAARKKQYHNKKVNLKLKNCQNLRPQIQESISQIWGL